MRAINVWHLELLVRKRWHIIPLPKPMRAVEITRNWVKHKKKKKWTTAKMLPHGVIFNAFAWLTFSLLPRSAEIAYCIYGSSCCDCAEEGSDWHSFTLFTNLFLIMPLNGRRTLGCAARLRYLPGATERKEKGKTLRDRRLYLLSLSRLSTSNCSPYKWCFSLSHLIVAARAVDETQEVITICASN